MNNNPDFTRLAEQVGLPHGRLVSMSKSASREEHSRHVVVYDAQIASAAGLGLWWGDLDLTVDEPKLQDLARTVGAELHVLHEGDTAVVRATGSEISDTGCA